MKNPTIITKLAAFALVLCMAVTMFASCSGSNDTVMSMNIDGKSYTIDENEFSLILTIKKLDYCCNMYMPRYLDTEETWAEKVEDGTQRTLEQYYMDMVLEQTKAVLIEKYLFDKFGLTISDETLKEHKDAEKEAIQYLGGKGAYKQYYGYTAERYYGTYMQMVARSEAVLEHLMGENGEMKVTDENLKKYYEDNYVGYQYIMLDMENKVVLDEDGNRVRETTTSKNDAGEEVTTEKDSYKTEKLTDDEKSEKQNLAATILAELEAGTATFEDMIAKYSDDYYSVAYPEGLFVLEEGTFLYADVDKEAKELEIGEYTDKAISANSAKEQYIVKRVALKDAVYSDETYADFFESYEDTVKYDKYEEHIKTFHENVTVNEAIAGRYTIADTFLSEYADVNFQYYYYYGLGAGA